MTVGKLVAMLRNRITLPPYQALFVFIKDNMPPTAARIADLYDQLKSSDGFIYVVYAEENTFG